MRREVEIKRGLFPITNCLLLIGLVLVLGANLTACGAGSEKWKEEVQLSDGRVIVIERELVLERGGDEWASNHRGVKPKENRFRFTNPDGSGNVIEWHSIKNSPQRRPEIPLILDIVSDQFVVFSSVAKSGGCRIYLKYIYQNGVWVEEKLPSTFEQLATNLYVFQNEGLKFINLEKKRENIADIRNQRFVEVGPKHPNCKGL